jgi:membrane-bound serine protease (ClpP class)
MLLFSFGVMMIFLEIKVPGTFIFGGLGVVSLILFLIGSNFIPINMLGLFLVFLGIGLIVAEIYVSSFGLLAFVGILTFAGGVRLLFDTIDSQGIYVSIWLLGSMVAMMLAFTFLLGRALLKDRKRKPATGINTIVGQEGTVMQWKGTHGKVFLNGEIWNARSDEEFKKDDVVKVVEHNQLDLKVER